MVLVSSATTSSRVSFREGNLFRSSLSNFFSSFLSSATLLTGR